MDKKLTIQDFWNLIDDWRSYGEPGHPEYLSYAEASLSKLTPKNLVHFKEIQEAYMAHAYTPGLWEAATAMKGGCSDSSFDYFLAWLIAQGKDTYLGALHNPDSLSQLDLDYFSEYSIPSFCEFEEFLYLPASAYASMGYPGDLYGHLQKLPQEELDELRAEIRYAPGMEQMSRSHQEMKERLPKLMEKTGYASDPGWLDPGRPQSWGCDWQTKPDLPDQSMKMQ